MKQVLSHSRAPARHWVGDGFPVHGLFGYNGQGVAERSPFLLLDYAAPYPFSPNDGPRRGVGQHPHRGFETVTMVFSGELEHRDSTGAGGFIGPGDVQWMTAGSGIIHEEFHAPAFSASGGEFHVAQLWVNLPAASKMTPPRYQHLSAAAIPNIALPNAAGQLRLIAGHYAGQHGPAEVHSPMLVADVYLHAGHTVALPQPEGWGVTLVVFSGAASVNGQTAADKELFTLSEHGTDLNIHATEDSHLLLLAGQPLAEPVFGYGPFVMNSRDEIVAAIDDYNQGRFGQVPAQ